MDIGLLLLRLAGGLILAAHGAQKLFGWFGGPGLDVAGQFMETLGFRPGRRHALMAGLVEAGGGLLLSLGFLTPLAAALFVSVMLVAAGSAHSGNGLFLTQGGYEYNLVLAALGLSLAFAGPGAFSLDAALGWTASGTWWGLAALLVGLVGGTMQLVGRRRAASDDDATAA